MMRIKSLLNECLRYFLFLSVITPVFGQISYNGTVNGTGMFGLESGDHFDLPFRLVETELTYARRTVELKSRIAIEARTGEPQAEIDLRELYLVWYPRFGDVKIGKQIHAWGAADGNNPTDNLNAYDFYYMFMTGVDRKIGSLSAAVTLYWRDYTLNLVVLPEHTANRFPFGEEDFPIHPPFEPENYVYIDDQLEYGWRLRRAFGFGDVSISGFSGRDRSFSLLGKKTPADRKFGFRKTDMFGADFVGFYGDFTLRTEAAYFRTENDYSDSDWRMVIPAEGEYIQYIVQLEYTGWTDVQLTGQLIGTDIRKVEGLMPGKTGVPVSLAKEYFQPGTGTPFAMITDLGMMTLTSWTGLDGRLEFRGLAFVNLEDDGLMLGAGFSWSPVTNWELESDISWFAGNDDPENMFTILEDFSHIRIGMLYHF